MKIEENITIKILMSEVEEVVKKQIEEQGHEVKSIQLDYETKRRNVGQFPMGYSEEYRELVGFKAEVVRKGTL
jgi:cell fate regulator YaaT (PSP1 superfamily)